MKKTEDMEPSHRKCEYCGKPLFFGRSDRRFCNDGCRNAFNRQKAAYEKQVFEHEMVPAVIKTIRNNFRILQSYWQQQGDRVYVPKDDLLEDGFHFGYFTSLQWDKSGGMWLFCFELGWHEVDEHYCQLRESEKQMYLHPQGITP